MDWKRLDQVIYPLVIISTFFPIVLISGCAAPEEPPSATGDDSKPLLPTPPPATTQGVERQVVEAAPQDLTELTTGNSVFALDLFQELNKGGDNIFFSPYSISLALAMTYGGARAETEEQMAQTLHFTLPQETLHPTFNALDTMLLGYGEGDEAFQLNIANAIWTQEGYQFLQSYLDLLANQYGAGLNMLDFAGDPEGSAAIVNDWVSEQTNDRIKNLVSPDMLGSFVRLLLTNAIYFKGQWALPFEEGATTEEQFTLLNGDKVAVPMMSQTEYFRYGEGDGYQAVALPYVGAPVSMQFILPQEGRFDDVQEAFSADFVDDLTSALAFRTVDLSVPRFTYESEFVLNEALKELGMPLAFSDGADFSGMTGQKGLFISDVVHKAFVAVDEAGTEAAAATAVAMAESAVPLEDLVEMRLDRPFFFLIRDDETGTILFAGRVLDPRS